MYFTALGMFKEKMQFPNPTYKATEPGQEWKSNQSKMIDFNDI